MPVSLTNGALLKPLGDLNLHQTVRFPDLLIHTKLLLTDTRGGSLTEIMMDRAAAGMRPPRAGQLIVNSCPFSVNWGLSCPVSELDSGTSSCISQLDCNIQARPVSRLPQARQLYQPCCAFKSEGRRKKRWLMDRETDAAHTELTSTGHL